MLYDATQFIQRKLNINKLSKMNIVGKVTKIAQVLITVPSELKMKQ